MTTEEYNGIVTRFFEALEYLKESHQLRGVKTFCDRYGIHRRTLQRIRKERTTELRASWLTYLVRDFGIDAQWLLTGEGQMHG